MKGLPHSIAQRLLNVSKKDAIDNNLISMRYAAERLLYRMGKSRYAEQFILKGATLLWAWYGSRYRTTKDVDLLGMGSPDPKRMKAIFREICQMDTSETDGLVFGPESVQATTIQEQQEYSGIRINLCAMLAQVRIDLQIDIGFGDAVTPAAEMMTFPTLLDMPPPKILAYSRYTVLAEKFMAMVVLGMDNSRMKDFYDIFVLLRTMEFDWDLLEKAIRATFAARNNSLPKSITIALSKEFALDKVKTIQWIAFVNRSNLAMPVGKLEDVMREIRERLSPALLRLGNYV